MRRPAATLQNNTVFLNVYDLQDNEALINFGLGVFHSGVEIKGEEWTFGSGGGIFSSSPKNAGSAKFRESINMGEYTGTSRDLDNVINELRKQYKGEDYNLVTKNCNSFSTDLIKLLIDKDIPGYVNRLAFIGSFFTCLLPPSMTASAPVDDRSASSTSSSGSAYKIAGGYGGSVSMNSFSGSGMKLGSKDDTVPLLETRQASSTNGLNDRRDRMRLAAINRATM